MPSPLLDRVTIVSVTLFLEAAMLLVATLWIQISQINLLPSFHLSKNALIISLFAGIGTACSGFILLFLAGVFKNTFKWLNSLRNIILEEIAPLFTELTFADIVLISFASGFCEEIFFRGIVQQQLGLLPTSILFGFFHCPSPRHLSYGLWALAAGLFFGWLFEWTGSLWVPIIAHALSNLIVISALRYVAKPKSSKAQ